MWENLTTIFMCSKFYLFMHLLQCWYLKMLIGCHLGSEFEEELIMLENPFAECPGCLKTPTFHSLLLSWKISPGWRPSQHGSRDMVALLKATTVTQRNRLFRFLPNRDSFAPRIHNMSAAAAMLTVNSRFLKSVTVR